MLVTPSLFRGRGARGAWDVTGAPLSADTAPCEPPPLASPWNVPPPPWNRVGGARLLHGSRLRRYFPATLPLRPGSRRVALLGGRGSGRAWAFGRPALWRARRPETATCPRDFRAGCREPPGGRFYIVPPLRSFGDAFRRVVTQPPGPRQSSQTPAMLAATVPVAPRPRDILLSLEICSVGF